VVVFLVQFQTRHNPGLFGVLEKLRTLLMGFNSTDRHQVLAIFFPDFTVNRKGKAAGLDEVILC